PEQRSTPRASGEVVGDPEISGAATHIRRLSHRYGETPDQARERAPSVAGSAVGLGDGAPCFWSSAVTRAAARGRRGSTGPVGASTSWSAIRSLRGALARSVLTIARRSGAFADSIVSCSGDGIAGPGRAAEYHAGLKLNQPSYAVVC